MALEAPPVIAGAPEAGLHLVRDVQPPGGTDLVDDSIQEACWFGVDTVAREDAVREERRQLEAVAMEVLDRGRARSRITTLRSPSARSASGASITLTWAPRVEPLPSEGENEATSAVRPW